jgi:hypothetical protein
MTAIALRESSGDTDAENHNTNGTVDRGLWQINSIWGRHSTKDPIANAKAAVHVYKTQGLKAWAVYNSGSYKTGLKDVNIGDPSKVASGIKARRAAQTITTGDPNARRAALQNYLNFSHDPDALLTLARSLENATKTRTVSSPRPGVRNAVGNAVGGKTHIASGADRPGAHTAHSVRQFVRMVSAQAGTPLTIGTGTNHSKMTVDGNVSDHWSGHAADIPATGAKLIRIGRAALIAAGMSPGKARKQTGGLYNVNGHQIIFNTHIGRPKGSEGAADTRDCKASPRRGAA